MSHQGAINLILIG